MSNRRLIQRYILRGIFPYILISLGLLTAILFAQQTVRYLEGTFQGLMPIGFINSVALSLLPAVLIFTLPMAVLAGTIIGLGRMGSDSELVAMRAAGVSTVSMLLPPLLLGLIVTIPSVYLNLHEGPQAWRHLRTLAIRGALYKLDSPVEPRTFTTEIPRYVIYVRDGDKSRGQWERVFIQTQDADRSTRLITARSGRIDSSPEKSELVLQDATTTKLPLAESGNASYVVEHLRELRVALDTGRADLLARIEQGEASPEQMNWNELRQLAATATGSEKREAAMLMHKRLAFSLAPLIFSFLGAALALRMRRGFKPKTAPTTFKARERMGRPSMKRLGARQWLVSFPTLLDLGLLRMMTMSFLFGFLALVAIFNIFTVFELWRFIAANHAGAKLIAEYLFYLLPLVSVELFPGSVLVAMLMTYALTAKRREAVAWWASGQSVYRLMLPGFAFALLIAAASWAIQERVMPQAHHN